MGPKKIRIQRQMSIDKKIEEKLEMCTKYIFFLSALRFSPKIYEATNANFPLNGRIRGSPFNLWGRGEDFAPQRSVWSSAISLSPFIFWNKKMPLSPIFWNKEMVLQVQFSPFQMQVFPNIFFLKGQERGFFCCLQVP